MKQIVVDSTGTQVGLFDDLRRTGPDGVPILPPGLPMPEELSEVREERDERRASINQARMPHV